MKRARTLQHHADLVDRMAAAQGVDLEEKMMAGLLTPGDVGMAVRACTGCANPDECEHWLVDHEAGEATPDYCRNAHLFGDLKAGRHA